MDGKLWVELLDAAGNENVSHHTIDLVSYSYDASDHFGRPQAGVWATDTHQVSRILKWAHRHRVAVIARGAGTSLSGMTVPSAGGIVLDMSRMDQILSLRVPDRLVILQPGVVYADLQETLAPHGFFFPPDPASGSVCTIGGNVATNAGGIRGAKYGVTQDYVLGLEMVLADGRIMRTGSKCMKSVSGYELTKAFVGSEGTLGVITEITLKIHPVPLHTVTASIAFKTLSDAGRAVSRIVQDGIVPSVMEIVDAVCVGILRRQPELEVPKVEALVLLETDGQAAEVAAQEMKRALAIATDCGGMHLKIARSREEAAKLWQARRALGGIITRLRPNFAVEDVTVPISRVPELLAAVQDISRRYNVEIATMGHAGDGNLHPAFTFDRSNAEEVDRVEKATSELFKVTVELEGTITGEHGIGLSKAAYLPWEHDATALRMMKALKQAFDPKNILNPGKMGLDH
ncbi:MAG: FAD-binding protein [Deltaproteobacteria bacterium]|nr:FAD-binding protein [Deltaproteobacteria bacterium]